MLFRLDRRIVPEEDAGAVEAELRAVIAEAADGALPDPRRGPPHPAGRAAAPLPGGAADRDALRRASAVMGEPITASGVPLYTDARHYAAHGIPVVLYGAGPRTIEEANAHRADERLPLADLHRRPR